MFDFLKRKKNINKNDSSIGVQKYYQLKQILENEGVLTPILTQTPAPLSIALDVIEANNLINYISTLTGLSEVDVISCGASAASEQHKERYDETIISMIKEKEALKHKEYKEIISEDDGWLDTLIEWANNNDLAEFQNYSTVPAYSQIGFPREKNQLLFLESLYIPKSGISYLPPELGKLQNLRGICLDGNNIDKYPEEMCHYKSLARLDMDENNLETLPPEIGNLTSLQILSLKSNKINDLPAEMTKLRNLKKLDLRGQPIQLSSKNSPLSSDGFKVLNHFHYDVLEE